MNMQNDVMEAIVPHTEKTIAPTLRIGFTTKRPGIEFQVSGKFSMYNHAGVALVNKVAALSVWHLHIEHLYPATYYYNILLGQFKTYQEADELYYKLLEKGIGAQIRIRGGNWPYQHELLNCCIDYDVIVDHFTSEQEALEFVKRNIGNFPYTITREKRAEPGIRIKVMDSEMEQICVAEHGIRFVPEAADTHITISRMVIADTFSEKEYSFRFLHPIEFRATNEGVLCIAFDTDVELVVARMLTAYAWPNAPMDYLKALAVVLRNQLVVSLNEQRLNDAFDWALNSMAKGYNQSEKIVEQCIKAARETTGQVLSLGNQLVPTYFTENCGGVFSTFGMNDSDAIFVDDSTRRAAENKLYHESSNDVFCSNHSMKEPNPWTSAYRWVVEFRHDLLKQRLSEFAGQDIGELFDIVPLYTNAAGHIQEIEVLAAHSNLTISGETNIRRAFGPDQVLSSCFRIEKEMDDDMIPATFILRGAGKGEGRGMCLAGAANMAHRGCTFNELLNHYFEACKLEKLY